MAPDQQEDGEQQQQRHQEARCGLKDGGGEGHARRSRPMRSSARTPIATVTRTVVSPSVSKPRKSTRITLTMLEPCASRGAASAKYAESLDVVPDAPMDNTSIVTRAPAARATTASRSLTNREERSPNPRNCENTSTKMTTVSVSTANWVIARSGAPRS